MRRLALALGVVLAAAGCGTSTPPVAAPAPPPPSIDWTFLGTVPGAQGAGVWQACVRVPDASYGRRLFITDTGTTQHSDSIAVDSTGC